jgi:hypothetical protein
MSNEQEKTAAVKADAFELGMHALLKEAGCQSQEEAQNFFKLASQLAQFPTKEAAFKALKEMGGKAVDAGKKVVDAAKEHPRTAIGATGGAAATGVVGAGVGAKLQRDEDKKKKPPFGKKK